MVFKGYKHSEESKRKTSESLKGHKCSKETRKKIRLSNLGQKRSEETKKKIGLSKLGHKKPENAYSFPKGIQMRKGKKNSEEWKRLMSEKMTGRKYTEELYPNHGLRNKHISEEHRKAISLANTGKIRTKEQREKMSLARMNPPLELRERLRKMHLGKKHTVEAIEKIKDARHKQTFPMQDTKIELKIQGFLKLLNIEFYTHYYTKEISHAYQCDILIPSSKTIIEADGNYWHGNKKLFPNLNEMQLRQIEEDKIRTKELQERGFRVIRLWEEDINSMDLNKFQEVIR